MFRGGYYGDPLLTAAAALALAPAAAWLIHRYCTALITQASADGESGCILLVIPLTTALTLWALVGPWTAPPTATWAVMKPAVWATVGNGIALMHTALFRGSM
ncbi:hypothetical protein AB0H73_35035 [Streptomyces olivoreticuli]